MAEALGSIDGATVALSAGSIATLLLRRFAPKVPGGLVVVVAGILLVAFAGLDDAGVALIAPVPSGLPLPGLPDFSALPALVPGALAIAVMAFLESAAVARGIRRPIEPQIDSNQELLATGAANVAGAFFTTMPAAGGFSQSAVNQSAGAKTQASTLVTVALAVLVALFLGPVLSLLPQATLAALVFVAVSGLIDIPELVRWARISPRDFWLAVAVALVGLSAGLLAAVAVGVAATLVMVLRELNTPKLEIEARRGDVVAVHVMREVYTASVLENEHALAALAAREKATALVLDLERQDVMTMTVLDMLADLDRELAHHGVMLHLAALPGSAAAVAQKTPWYQVLQTAGRGHATVEDALAAASA